MEPMTGYDLLKEVRAESRTCRETPFIMITAESKTENVIAAKKAGVNNYIVKPFNAATLEDQDRSRVPGHRASVSRAASLRAFEFRNARPRAGRFFVSARPVIPGAPLVCRRAGAGEAGRARSSALRLSGDPIHTRHSRADDRAKPAGCRVPGIPDTRRCDNRSVAGLGAVVLRSRAPLRMTVWGGGTAAKHFSSISRWQHPYRGLYFSRCPAPPKGRSRSSRSRGGMR